MMTVTDLPGAADFKIQREKIEQALDLMREHGVDAWLTLVRETSLSPDPALDLILGLDMTWLSAFLLTASGERIAIVGPCVAPRASSRRPGVEWVSDPQEELIVVA